MYRERRDDCRLDYDCDWKRKIVAYLTSKCHYLTLLSAVCAYKIRCIVGHSRVREGITALSSDDFIGRRCEGGSGSTQRRSAVLSIGASAFGFMRRARIDPRRCKILKSQIYCTVQKVPKELVRVCKRRREESMKLQNEICFRTQKPDQSCVPRRRRLRGGRTSREAEK